MNYKITPEPEDEEIKEALKKAPNTFKYETAKQKYYLYATPYIGYKVNENFDIYAVGGLRMVRSKYLEKKNKSTWHPTVGLGAHYTFSNGVFMKFEYGHVFKKKKEVSDEEEDKEDGILLKGTGKVRIHHSENILKLGVGIKF